MNPTKISKPFKGMSPSDITQIFHEGHKAWDVVSFQKGLIGGYGTPLCAAEKMKIELIVGDSYTPDSDSNLKRGYGVWATGLETGLVYVYWHILPICPVNVGDIIERGKILAFMGNAGQVYRAGVYVPLEQRTKEPFPGTHLHWEIYQKGHPIGFVDGGQVDPMGLVDFTLEPTYTNLDLMVATANVLKKILALYLRIK